MPVIVSKQKQKVNNNFLVKILLGLLVILILLVGYLGWRYRTLQTDPDIRAKNETAKIVKSLSRLMIIPDETGVVVATVSDKNKLAGQDFFRLAENGDKVVVFPQAQLAVLYRPAVDKIVTTAPLGQAQVETKNAQQNSF